MPTGWAATDTARATLALAAHRMVRAGVAGLTLGQVTQLAALGVSSFRSGAFSADFDTRKGAQIKAGGLDSTVYGQDYLQIGGRYVSSFGCTSPQLGQFDSCRDSLLYGYPYA